VFAAFAAERFSFSPFASRVPRPVRLPSVRRRSPDRSGLRSVCDAPCGVRSTPCGLTRGAAFLEQFAVVASARSASLPAERFAFRQAARVAAVIADAKCDVKRGIERSSHRHVPRLPRLLLGRPLPPTEREAGDPEREHQQSPRGEQRHAAPAVRVHGLRASRTAVL
jgi:hypothetical protein